MSEVKRYAIRGAGKWEAYEVKAGAWVRWHDFDAQRLRADTAEAELKREKKFHAVNVSESERMLAAAEQRIADLYSKSAINAAAKKLAECMDYPWEHMPEKGRASMCDHAKSIIDAALNPNPEAESHECTHEFVPFLRHCTKCGTEYKP